MGKKPMSAIVFAALVLSLSCSFDYGALSEETPGAVPDVVMNDVEYVRVRDGEPVVRLQARSVERYESERRMVIDSPRFEQYSDGGAEGAFGGSSTAVVYLESGDVDLSGDVSLSIPDEELVIAAEALSWRDEERKLRGAADKPVLVKKTDGSYLSGVGFEADARSKSWELTGSVTGVLVEEEENVPAEGVSR